MSVGREMWQAQQVTELPTLVAHPLQHLGNAKAATGHFSPKHRTSH